MTEPLTSEEKAALLRGFNPSEVAQENLASKKQKKQKPTEFSRPPVVSKSGGVGTPRNWFPRGRADRTSEEQY